MQLSPQAITALQVIAAVDAAVVAWMAVQTWIDRRSRKQLSVCQRPEGK